MCGEVSPAALGSEVQISGWVQAVRMDKFIILRDRTGLCQVYSPFLLKILIYLVSTRWKVIQCKRQSRKYTIDKLSSRYLM